MSVYFQEGQKVTYIGPDAEGANGRIISIASTSSAHVMWDDGPLQGTATLTDLYDILPSAQAKKDYAASDPMMLVAVRKAYDVGQESEVVNMLSTHGILERSELEDIAKEAQSLVERRIRASAAMDLPSEQLEPHEFEGVVRLSSRVLLRDAFSELGLDE